MAKEFGRARCPVVTNALTLEAYISLVAPMSTSVGVNWLLLLVYIDRSGFRTSALVNRMTCYTVAP